MANMMQACHNIELHDIIPTSMAMQ